MKPQSQVAVSSLADTLSALRLHVLQTGRRGIEGSNKLELPTEGCWFAYGTYSLRGRRSAAERSLITRRKARRPKKGPISKAIRLKGNWLRVSIVKYVTNVLQKPGIYVPKLNEAFHKFLPYQLVSSFLEPNLGNLTEESQSQMNSGHPPRPFFGWDIVWQCVSSREQACARPRPRPRIACPKLQSINALLISPCLQRERQEEFFLFKPSLEVSWSWI